MADASARPKAASGAARAWRQVVSLVFVGQIYAMMPILALVFSPLALMRREWALAGVKLWCRWVRSSARLMVGLGSEVRGTVPRGEVLIAAKHQSFFDIIILLSVLPSPRFVMKRELERMPILGWYARRIGCISVDRGKRSKAMRAMLDEALAGQGAGGQIVIYPQGTRVPPGEARPYKIGAGVLYDALRLPCVPVACNVGLFWPRRGVRRDPGLAVVEFLDPIPPGLALREVMGRMETAIEAGSDRLLAEAGFDPPPAP